MIKSVRCRAGATEWELVRLENRDFATLVRGLRGHPAYYRLVEPSQFDDYNGTRTNGYEVWPLPAEGVEVVPVYND